MVASAPYLSISSFCWFGWSIFCFFELISSITIVRGHDLKSTEKMTFLLSKNRCSLYRCEALSACVCLCMHACQCTLYACMYVLLHAHMFIVLYCMCMYVCLLICMWAMYHVRMYVHHTDMHAWLYSFVCPHEVSIDQMDAHSKHSSK